jgi:putrescine aminotransferase
MNLNTHLTEKEVIRIGKARIAPGEISLLQENGIFLMEQETEGAYIQDAEGKRYLDCRSDAGSFNVGRKNPAVIKAVMKAMREHDLGDNFFISEAKVKLATKLAEISPKRKLTCCTYSVSGGEAVDFAIKLARGYTGREEIIAAKKGYHGVTGYALSATAEKAFKKPFAGLTPGFKHVAFNDIHALKRAISKKTAAVLLEPVQGEGGVHVPSDDYFKEVRKLCDRKGVLLILDEIQTGLGRTGKMFCCDHWGVVPDIMTIGKSLSGGIYPITATLYRKELQEFVRKHPFTHLSTFGGADLGCIAALAAIDQIEKRKLVANAKKMGTYLLRGMRRLAGKYPMLIADARGLGLELAIEMSTADLGKKLSSSLRKTGVMVPFGVQNPKLMRMLPPLIIQKKDADFLLNALDECLGQLPQPKWVERLLS